MGQYAISIHVYIIQCLIELDICILRHVSLLMKKILKLCLYFKMYIVLYSCPGYGRPRNPWLVSAFVPVIYFSPSLTQPEASLKGVEQLGSGLQGEGGFAQLRAQSFPDSSLLSQWTQPEQLCLLKIWKTDQERKLTSAFLRGTCKCIMNTFAHSLWLAYVYIGYICAICQMLLCCLGNFIFWLLIDFLLAFLLFNLSFDSFMQVFKAVWSYPPSLSSLIPSVSRQTSFSQ